MKEPFFAPSLSASHENVQPPKLPQTPQLHLSGLSEGQLEHKGISKQSRIKQSLHPGCN